MLVRAPLQSFQGLPHITMVESLRVANTAITLFFGKNPVNTFASHCLVKSWSSCTTIQVEAPKSWKRKLPMSMTDRSVWQICSELNWTSIMLYPQRSESLKFIHSPGLHPLQGFHARQRHSTGCSTEALWQCRKAALHPQQPVTQVHLQIEKLENLRFKWKPKVSKKCKAEVRSALSFRHSPISAKGSNPKMFGKT